jgi:hypothetical protein
MIFSSISFSSPGCFICNCNMNAIFLQSCGRAGPGRTGPQRTAVALGQLLPLCCAGTDITSSSGIRHSCLDNLDNLDNT